MKNIYIYLYILNFRSNIHFHSDDNIHLMYFNDKLINIY